ncbi:MAG: carboxylating nicotinate-nucleotide diphosphorylase [Phycisphaerae bacterium]
MSMPIPPAVHGDLQALLELARREDVGPGDVTSTILPADVQAVGRFVAREPMTLAGIALLGEIAQAYDGELTTELLTDDAQTVAAGTPLAEWRGPARSMLTAERVALNFLQRLCGIATLTARYVAEVQGTSAGVYDTRKTTPGWRELEKYAVRCGGGRNHRKGLYDAILVKDNHLAILHRSGVEDPVAALPEVLGKLRNRHPHLQFVQLEVDTLDQLRTALTLPVDIILLDNMTPDQLRQAVALREEAGRQDAIELEASGGISLQTLRGIAETGVDRISVGAITHSAKAVDVGLDVEV